jgi:nucleotide-binding universal stress UspA family protein
MNPVALPSARLSLSCVADDFKTNVISILGKEGAMYKRILVPLDGSAISEGVLRYARFFARAFDAPVELLHVIDPARAQPFSSPMQAREYLEKIAASFADVVDIRCTVDAGNPPDVIVELAAAQPGTVIAMVTHGYTGTKRWLMGSVAEHVLNTTTNHLVLVRAGEEVRGSEAELKTLIVPLDGSGVAERVLPTVSELAVRLKLDVVLIRVVKQVYTAPPEAILPVFGANIANLKQLWEQVRLAAEQYLIGRAEDLRGRGLVNVASMALFGGAGGAAAEIIDLAKQTPHNIIVMSTHGESGFGRWVIGSVTRRVVRHSAGPVLVIR